MNFNPQILECWTFINLAADLDVSIAEPHKLLDSVISDIYNF